MAGSHKQPVIKPYVVATLQDRSCGEYAQKQVSDVQTTSHNWTGEKSVVKQKSAISFTESTRCKSLNLSISGRCQCDMVSLSIASL